MLNSRLTATGTHNARPTSLPSAPVMAPTPVETTLAAAHASGDEVELSRETDQEPEGSERVNSLLQGMQSWDGDKGESPMSKQAGAVKVLRGIWESRPARAARGTNGARQAANQENSTCQRIAGGASAIGGGASLIPTPWTQAAGRIGQGLGALGTYVVCPLIDNRRSDEEVREIRRQQQEISDRIQRMPAGVPGGERWRPGSGGAGR